MDFIANMYSMIKTNNKVIDIRNVIKMSRVLPQSMAIAKAGTHLHSIGLSLYKPLNARNRSRHKHPFLVFIAFVLWELRQIGFIVIPEQNQQFYTLYGDWFYFVGMRIQCSICVILYIIIPLMSQLIHYYNYKNGVKPT